MCWNLDMILYINIISYVSSITIYLYNLSSSITFWFVPSIRVISLAIKLVPILLCFEVRVQIRNSFHPRSSLTTNGERSLTINVLIFIKFDFNWNVNWNMLMLVIYIVIYVTFCICSPVTSDTIICYLYCWYMPVTVVILFSYLLSLCKFPISIESLWVEMIHTRTICRIGENRYGLKWETQAIFIELNLGLRVEKIYTRIYNLNCGLKW